MSKLAVLFENWRFCDLENSRALGHAKTQVLLQNSSFHIFHENSKLAVLAKTASFDMFRFSSDNPKLEFSLDNKVFKVFQKKTSHLVYNLLFNIIKTHKELTMNFIQSQNEARIRYLHNSSFLQKLAWLKWIEVDNSFSKFHHQHQA